MSGLEIYPVAVSPVVVASFSFSNGRSFPHRYIVNWLLPGHVMRQASHLALLRKQSEDALCQSNIRGGGQKGWIPAHLNEIQERLEKGDDVFERAFLEFTGGKSFNDWKKNLVLADSGICNFPSPD